MRHRPLNGKSEILDVIGRCQVCHVAMVDQEGDPYLVPMNFGFSDDIIYLHSAQEGKKIDCLKHHPYVCINFTIDHVLRYQNENVACSWSMKYRSVNCYGTVEFLEDPEEKRMALDIIMKQYTDRQFSYNPPSIREVRCWKIKVSRFDGRAYGY